MFQKILICFFFLLVAIGQIFAQGATVPFKTYEAENGLLGGGAAILSMSALPTAPTVQLESSGRKCVELNAEGESVSWTTSEITNTLVVRASIPDAPSGGGITATLDLYVDGVFRQALTLTSKYSWIYGVNAMIDNNPATGTPHRFYESDRAWIVGTPIAPGSTMMLKKDVDNTAGYYRIDLIQLENVGPALTQPANTLSVISYGATPNDNTDDSQAFVNCIAACQSQKKGMWIPAGVFYSQGIINATGINIYGAGIWYTTNYRIIGARHKWNLTNCTIQDLTIFNPETGRDQAQGHDSGMTIQGDLGWTVQRVWAHHCFFWCSGTDGTIKDCRTIESWADGINLNNGPTFKPDYAGKRLTAQNNYIIGPGDDGIAINSQNGSGVAGNMVDTKVLNNTSIGVLWGNGMRIAGGRNSVVQNNLITDPTDGSGIRVGEFGPSGNPCESALVADNLILRGCGIRGSYGHGGITVSDSATATIQSNRIIDSPGLGIDVQNCTATFTNNVIENPTLHGFLVKAASKGSGTFSGNTVTGLKSGQVAFRNDAPTTFTISSWNNSWQPNEIENEYSNLESIIYLTNNQNTLIIKNLTDLTEVKIYSISGQIVSNTKTTGIVDIGNLVSGIYVVSFKNHKPQRFIKR